ncbi:MAG: hypothetical protein GY856_11840 [bacterium]|nr:hypothetical protein [bacterium]
MDETIRRAQSAGFVLAAYEARLTAVELRLEHLREPEPLAELQRETAQLGLGCVAQRAGASLEKARSWLGG